MTLTKRNIYILIVLTIIFLVAFTALRIYLVCNYYDINENLYRNNTPAVTAFNIGFAASCVIIAVLGFIQKNNREYGKLPEAGNGAVFTGALCGFMFVTSLLIQCIYFLPDVLRTESLAQKILFIVSLLLTIPSALYYFKSASTTKLNRLNSRILSLCPILWAVLFTVYMYFDTSTVINSPERIIVQLAFISAMLYMTSEARFHLGTAKPRLHLSISLLSILIIGTACIPNFVLALFWSMPFTANTVYSALLIAVAAHIITSVPQLASEDEV